MKNLIKLCIEQFSVKTFIIYMIRWQLSTPILGFFTWLISDINPLSSILSAIVGNLFGSVIFYWVDLITFSSNQLSIQWEAKFGECYDCSKMARVYRIAKAPGYNRVKDPEPEFRCEECSQKKHRELFDNGIVKTTQGL